MKSQARKRFQDLKEMYVGGEERKIKSSVGGGV